MIKRIHVIINIFVITFTMCISKRCKNPTLKQFVELIKRYIVYLFLFDLDESCSYVVLKIDNVKSTTTVVKGSQPSWEQEFYL